jgi:short subunit fatty acids transporter
MSDKDFIPQDDGIFSTGNIIIFSFVILLIVLFGYLYFANKALIANGKLNNKKKSSKSKKRKEFWSYGD